MLLDPELWSRKKTTLYCRTMLLISSRSRVAQRLPQIDPADLGADGRLQRVDGQLMLRGSWSVLRRSSVSLRLSLFPMKLIGIISLHCSGRFVKRAASDGVVHAELRHESTPVGFESGIAATPGVWYRRSSRDGRCDRHS